ncbi:MAG: galactose oxidase, partial [Bacteroidales bacterium]
DETFDDKYTTIVGTGKVGLSIGGKGYLATGGQTSGVETWEYNPAQDLWTEKTNFEGSARTDAVGFVLDNRGYVTTGKSSNYYFDDIWGFDPNAAYNEYD